MRYLSPGKSVFAVLCGMLTGGAAPPAVATGLTGIHPVMNTRFQASGGAFFANADPSFRLDDGSDEGTKIKMTDLGIDDDVVVPVGSLRWRITDRWRLEGLYFGLDEKGSQVIDERIEWGDLDFAVGAQVDAKVKTDVWRALIGYSFVKNDRWELGAGLGIHWLNAEARLSGQASVDGEPVVEASEKADVSGPVPNIGFYGDYAFNERWLVQGRIDWFSANIDDYDGSLWRAGGSVVYQPFKHVNFGLGYEYLDIDVDIDKDDWDGEIDADYYGPTVFLGLTF
jgi:opacity protein-like surface antigen